MLDAKGRAKAKAKLRKLGLSEETIDRMVQDVKRRLYAKRTGVGADNVRAVLKFSENIVPLIP